MSFKTSQRQRRAVKIRAKSRELRKNRLTVFRSLRHIYAQIIAVDGTVLVSASTKSKEYAAEFKNAAGNKVEAAKRVGALIAKAAKSKNIADIMFDRAGYRYHGRVKALADAARENGLEF